jgi:hypothetical protein
MVLLLIPLVSPSINEVPQSARVRRLDQQVADEEGGLPEMRSQIFTFVSHARLIKSTRGHPLNHRIHAGPNKTGETTAKDILAQGSELSS